MSTPRAPVHRPLAYSPAEVADLIGRPAATVYGWVRKGIIPVPPARRGERRRAIVIPSWRLDAYLATGDWDHEAWRPVPPGAHNLPANRPEERSATQAER